MKTIRIFLACNLVLLMFIANACINFNAIDGNGKVVTQDRKLTGFTGIKASKGLNVIVTMGEQEMVEVKADENLMNVITTEIKNNILVISSTENIKNATSKDIIVTAKSLTSIKGSAGVSIKSTNVISSENLEIESSSGSEMNLSVTCGNLSCETSSGSEILLNGTSKSINANSSSGSYIKAFDLVSDFCNVEASSGSDIQINVVKDLSVKASSGA